MGHTRTWLSIFVALLSLQAEGNLPHHLMTSRA